MTWRVCSPPWPGRQNLGSWPGRRQCGLPLAGQPLRPASHLQGGARRPRRFRGPARSRARLATALVVAAAALGSVFAAYIDVLPSPIQQLAHVTVAAPAPPSSGALRPVTGKRPQATAPRGPAQQPARPRAAPLDEPGSGSRPADPDAELQAPPDPVIRSRGDRAVLRPGPGALAESAAEGVGSGAKASGYPSLPSWYPGEHCTGIPARPSDEPTLHPYVPGTQSS